MLSLSPEKLFIVLIVALVLLGPDKLPKLARQLGAGWAEVREVVPELPSTQEIVRIARSPVSYLNSLADSPDGQPTPAAEDGTAAPAPQERPAALGHPPGGPLRVPVDPGMN